MVKKKSTFEIVSLAELLAENADVKAMQEEERLSALAEAETEIIVVPEQVVVEDTKTKIQPVVEPVIEVVESVEPVAVVVKPVKKSKVSVFIQQSDAYPVEVQFTFTNESVKPVHLLVPRLGVDGFDGAYVKVDSDAPYLGALVKKSPYTVNDVVELAPNASVSSAWIRLDSLYDLGESDFTKIKYVATHPLTGKLTYLTSVTSEWFDVIIPSEAVEEEMVVEEEVYVEQPQPVQEEFEFPTVSEEKSYRSYWKTKTDEMSDKLNPAVNKRFWLMLSLISTGIALLGTIIWVIPIALFSFAAVVLGVISLKKKEEPRNYTVLSIVASSVMFLMSISLYLVAITLIYIIALISGV